MHVTMDVKALKLRIIQQVSQCNDTALLTTVADMLDALQGNATVPMMPPRPFPLNASPTPSPLDDDLRDLQASIDEVFGTH